MDTENQKPTKNAGNVSSSPSRLSAEDRLKKSMKSLSHTSGGFGGGDSFLRGAVGAHGQGGIAVTADQK